MCVFAIAELNSSDIFCEVLLRRAMCYLHYDDPESSLNDFDAIIYTGNTKFLAQVHNIT